MRKIHVVCGTIVFDGNKFILVRQGRGSGRGRWCYPGGNIETNEDILSAAKREVKEETGLEVGLQGLVGVYEKHSNRGNLIVFIFKASVVGGKLKHAEGELLDAKWFTPEEFSRLNSYELRDPDIRRTMDDCTSREPFPLSIFHSTPR